jgi:hypothetical protein
MLSPQTCYSTLTKPVQAQPSLNETGTAARVQLTTLRTGLLVSAALLLLVVHTLQSYAAVRCGSGAFAARMAAKGSVGVHCVEAGQQLRPAVGAVVAQAQLPAVAPAHQGNSHASPRKATHAEGTCRHACGRAAVGVRKRLRGTPAPHINVAAPVNGRAVRLAAGDAHQAHILQALRRKWRT